MAISNLLRQRLGPVLTSEPLGQEMAGYLDAVSVLASTETAYIDGLTPGTVTASKAVVVDANKDAGDFRNLDVTNLDAGLSGTAGSVDVFPTTAAKGKLSITAADSVGDTTTTIVNASQAGARTYTIPDAGASASFLMGAGDATRADELTLTNASATGEAVLRVGGTATEGLEIKVVDKTVSPSAVETAVFTVPAGAVILSVQGNVETALTGGGTTVTWALGTAADPDKYGTPASDALTQNTKSDSIPDWAVLGSTEPIVLTGAATGGGSDGDTALTVGSVRVMIVYAVLNSLDDA